MTTIVIPIYGAAEAVKGLLESLRRVGTSGQSIIAIDDGSLCPAVDSVLQHYAVADGIRWIRERENRGFVETANLGMALCDDDVLLLNSDTIVTPGWLKKMEVCLASDDTIGTVTPWSNNAEICSLPHFVQSHPPPSDPDAVARIIASAGSPEYPSLPTAVGFCMLIRRVLIDEIGGFDAATFGHGYGEENDFCMRAINAGYRNVLCDDAYVVHRGGESFSALNIKPGPDTMQRLLAKHPEYQEMVTKFIAEDPCRQRREDLCGKIAAAGISL